ncbi:hypothetical protein [Pseudomonas citronellolis]|uniref:hypothetical protein n=1 Tax=Pseudomonas citronellolis TaxID=53408 RepID=UPI000853BB14|nr:hypothetical protein [Pseudomonas humi]
MTMHESERHATLVRVVAIVWLSLISAAAVFDHAALSGLAEQLEARAPIARVESIERKLAKQIEHDRQQPDALAQARYEADRRALDQRLAAIEQSLGNRHAEDNLLPLQARLEQLETQLAAARRTTSVPARPRQHASAAVPPAPRNLPFDIVGVELRADERFLAILPSGASAAAQVRLLRVGETESGWRLDAIDGSAAVLRRSNETLRLAIPVR